MRASDGVARRRTGSPQTAPVATMPRPPPLRDQYQMKYEPQAAHTCAARAVGPGVPTGGGSSPHENGMSPFEMSQTVSFHVLCQGYIHLGLSVHVCIIKLALSSDAVEADSEFMYDVASNFCRHRF